MSCDVKYDNIIFSVHKVSRFNINEYYVFIGDTDNNINNTLKKLEKRENLNKEDVKILRENYFDYYNEWINIVKNKIKIIFIPNRIQIDDSIGEIRKKIFIFLSNFEEELFILPENQELWLEKNNGTKQIIGYYYENIIINPHILDSYKNYDKFDFVNNKKNTSENRSLIYDFFNNSNVYKKIIYLSDVKDEEKFLKKLKINITEDLINNYFKKYWPYVNLSYNNKEIKNNYLLLKEFYKKESYLYSLINNIKINKNIFGSCNILTIKIIINRKISSSNVYDVFQDNVNDDSNKELDLFQIFDYLRENKIDEKTFFVQYSENIMETPFSIISKKAITDNIINKESLKKWMGINNNYRNKNGITIKRYLKDYNNQPRHSSIFLTKSGKIILTVSFDAENNATFKDIEYTIKDCKNLIEDINKNRITKKLNEKDKIELPNINILNNKITLKDNTNIIFMNIIIPLKIDKKIDFKKLYDFSKKFPNFLAEFPKDDLKKDDNKMENSIKLRYKRVSGFANMNDILLEIDKLKQLYDKDTLYIIKFLEKKYQKSVDEIKGYLLEWEKKYSSSKTSKVASEFKTGILVTISDNNILLNGITKIYQIPLLYNFFVTFLTLFLNYEDFMKNKDFKKIFFSKNLEKNFTYYEDSYEYNKNAKLENLNKIYNLDYNLDDDLYFNEELHDINEIYNEIINKNINSQPKIIGLADDKDLDKMVKLVCDDPLPNKDTCVDFCNDKKYFLRRLQRYDNKLFKFSLGKTNLNSQYSRKCQQSKSRQPVVLPYDPSTNDKIKKDSYTYAIKYGSDPTLFSRWYICPKIWCPYCEIPIFEGDIDPKTIRMRTTDREGGICKTGICPNGDHQVFIREKNNEYHEYPGFLDESSHPNNLCLPCCFAKPHSDPKSKFYQGFKKCLGIEIENKNIKDGQVYILGKTIQIDKDRFGKLPIDIARILKTNLETGYIGYNSGYARKGIKHEKNNSFLSAICDILSCDKNNIKIDVSKIKRILVDKLNIDLFKSLHSGNLENIFHNLDNNLSAMDNYKKYLLNDQINIDHLYLWDYLQRENILFDEGVNIFIFEKNTLLCPIGEKIDYFYDYNKKNILLIKFKEYYEPIYYLIGSGKITKSKCIYNYDTEEIKKIFEISLNGCKNEYDIDWISVLKNNIKKYDLKIDNINIENGIDLQTLLNEILISIKNKKLDTNYVPVLQYIDSYNKVFGIKLNNGLYLPVSPSKLNEKIKYKVIDNINEIDKINIENIIKFTNEIIKYTNLKYKITHKILDLKNKKNIIALVNEYNRFIPIVHVLDSSKYLLKISNLNYYSDVDESLNNKIEKLDNRIEQINKKNFEEETYIRMKYELSKFLQIKTNKIYYDKIIEIINLEKKDIVDNRNKMFNLLNSIFLKLVTNQNNNIDYYNYKTPNKRIPCFIRNISKNNTKLSCNDDPHCISVDNSCKLFINNKNLLNIHQKFDNYNYYLSKIVDEILRFKIKRNEILNDNIPSVINKEIIPEDPNRYIIIHTLNENEIDNKINQLYLDNKGLYIDNRKLYEETYSKEYSFKKNNYVKSNTILIKNNKLEYLSIYWIRVLGNNYKINLNTNENNNLFFNIVFILNLKEFKNNTENIDINILKSNIIEYLKNTKLINQQNIINRYKKNENKTFKYISSFDSLFNEILNTNYNGVEIDLDIISKIYNINIVILDKRIKKDQIGYRVFKTSNFKSNYFVLLYKSIIYENNTYNIIQHKNKYIFKINELPSKFVHLVLSNDK